jgi:hypothetical protein
MTPALPKQVSLSLYSVFLGTVLGENPSGSLISDAQRRGVKENVRPICSIGAA